MSAKTDQLTVPEYHQLFHLIDVIDRGVAAALNLVDDRLNYDAADPLAAICGHLARVREATEQNLRKDHTQAPPPPPRSIGRELTSVEVEQIKAAKFTPYKVLARRYGVPPAKIIAIVKERQREKKQANADARRRWRQELKNGPQQQMRAPATEAHL